MSLELQNDTDMIEDNIKATVDGIYFLAQINIVISLITILINLLHFSVLTRKELRINPVFILMIFLSVCDILTAIFTSIIFFHTIRTYGRTDYCYQYDSYAFLVFNLTASCVIGASSVSIPWLILMMTFYRAITVTFPMNRLFEKLTKPRLLIPMVSGILMIEAVRMSGFSLNMVRIERKNDSAVCHLIEDPNSTVADQYGLFVEDLEFTIITNKIMIGISAIQLIGFVSSTLWLVLGLRKAEKEKKKLLNSDESKKSNTNTLVLAMNFFTFLSTITDFTFLLAVLVDDTLWILRIIIPFKYFFTYLQSSCHCIICYSLSSQYRSVARHVFSRERMKNVILVKSIESKTS